MENLETTQAEEGGKNAKNSGPLIIAIVTVIILTLALWQFFMDKKLEPVAPIVQEVSAKIDAPLIAEPLEDPNAEPEVSPSVIELPIMESIPELVIELEDESSEIAVPEVNPLPVLDESDEYVKLKLPNLTWRNELLSLLVTDDLVRRFVVFTDNFAQGLIAYDHSLFNKPREKFSVDETAQQVEGVENVWRWDNKTSQRFDLYVDLLRSVDSSTLINLYLDIKPLIDEAYNELGYEDDFTYTLQDAITRVLDMELPQSSMNITRSSVMYKYQDPALESLDDSDKLLLRIGKENLLIIKSVLLEVNEKLTKRMPTS